MIVAGGVGGASGDCLYVSPAGFGGGLSGGNCYYLGPLNDQEAGTPTGSTKGLTYDNVGDPGSFGLEARVGTTQDGIQVEEEMVVGMEEAVADMALSMAIFQCFKYE